MTKKLGCSVRFRHLKRRKTKARGDYGKRNRRLPSVGYASYREYLQSDDWKEIRTRVLDANPTCVLCSVQARVVHHYCYFDAVLLGLADDMLFAMCDKCHRQVEFDGKVKLTLKASQKKLCEALVATGRKPDVERLQARYAELLNQARTVG